MWRRIGAHAIDLGFILVTAAIVYFSFVFRLSFNAESYDKAQQAAVKAQLDSSLYVKWDSTYVASPADVGSFESVASFS